MTDNTILVQDAKALLQRVDLSELDKKTILITGATGLIGTYFVFSIIEAFKQGIKPKKLSIVFFHSLPFYLEVVRDYDWIELLQGDLSNDDFVSTIASYDYIIHLAGYGQPAQFATDPIKTIKLNTTLTMQLLEKVNQDGKFLFASSSGIYNGLEKESFTEEDVGTTNTLHPRACYYEGKKCGEVIVNGFRVRGVNAKSVRLSYTYGPAVRFSDERALYSFIKKAMNGKIELLDDGSAQRIYCYVLDACVLMWKILFYGDKEIYNLGGIEITTILELAQSIGKKMNAKVIVPAVNHSVAGNHMVERLDMSRTLTQFPITYTSLDDGLDRTIAWYKSNYGDMF